MLIRLKKKISILCKRALNLLDHQIKSQPGLSALSSSASLGFFQTQTRGFLCGLPSIVGVEEEMGEYSLDWYYHDRDAKLMNSLRTEVLLQSSTIELKIARPFTSAGGLPSQSSTGSPRFSDHLQQQNLAWSRLSDGRDVLGTSVQGLSLKKGWWHARLLQFRSTQWKKPE